jgi:hypothetical protein
VFVRERHRSLERTFLEYRFSRSKTVKSHFVGPPHGYSWQFIFNLANPVVQSEKNDPFTAATISNGIDGWYLSFFGVMDVNIQ